MARIFTRSNPKAELKAEAPTYNTCKEIYMPHVMVVVDLFILVAIIWAFSENNRQLKLLKKAKEAKHH